MKYLLALFSVAVFAFGGGSPGTYRDRSGDWKAVYKEEGFDKAPKCIVKVKETIKVRGTLDGKGCRYVWVGKNASDCHAKDEVREDNPRMFEMQPGSRLKNLQAECMLEAIRMNDDTVVENITVIDVEEDAIATNGTGNTIRNNKFYLASDKAIQRNQAKKVLIEGNYFKHVLRGFAATGDTRTDYVFRDNRCVNCELMLTVHRKQRVLARLNTMDGGEAMFETVENGEIDDQGGNYATGGAEIRSEDGTNNIK